MNGELKAKLRDKKYRDAYVAETLRTVLASQIQSLRHKKGWTQTELAHKLGTTQNVVSRLEDPDYGKFSLQTLLQLASAFDVAFLAKFVSFPRFDIEFLDISPASLVVPSFDDEDVGTITYFVTIKDLDLEHNAEDTFSVPQSDNPVENFKDAQAA